MLKYLRDPRDLPLMRMLMLSSVLIPAALMLYAAQAPKWWMAALYLLLWGAFAERFTMAYHCVLHRPLFKRKHRLLRFYLHFVLGPLFGQTPVAFALHHRMHHVEDNQPDDLSSTMMFRRDSALGFLKYYFRFAVLGLVELPFYLLRHESLSMAMRFIVGEFGFYAIVGVAMVYKPLPTFMVFVVPYLVVRFMMIMGNWVEHAFIDASDPENPYKHSINTTVKGFNARCYNAGYHIYHHVKAYTHYTELAEEFEQNKEVYGRNDAIVFEKIDLLVIWFLLITRRHATLARYFVRLPGAPARTDEQVVEMFRQRLQPVRLAEGNTAMVPA